MKKNILSYVVIGFKLFVLLLLAGLIMVVPNVIFRMVFRLAPIFALILSIPLILLGFAVEGWLVWKYRRWLLK